MHILFFSFQLLVLFQFVAALLTATTIFRKRNDGPLNIGDVIESLMEGLPKNFNNDGWIPMVVAGSGQDAYKVYPMGNAVPGLKLVPCINFVNPETVIKDQQFKDRLKGGGYHALVDKQYTFAKNELFVLLASQGADINLLEAEKDRQPGSIPDTVRLNLLEKEKNQRSSPAPDAVNPADLDLVVEGTISIDNWNDPNPTLLTKGLETIQPPDPAFQFSEIKRATRSLEAGDVIYGSWDASDKRERTPMVVVEALMHLKSGTRIFYHVFPLFKKLPEDIKPGDSSQVLAIWPDKHSQYYLLHDKRYIVSSRYRILVGLGTFRSQIFNLEDLVDNIPIEKNNLEGDLRDTYLQFYSQGSIALQNFKGPPKVGDVIKGKCTNLPKGIGDVLLVVVEVAMMLGSNRYYIVVPLLRTRPVEPPVVRLQESRYSGYYALSDRRYIIKPSDVEYVSKRAIRGKDRAMFQQIVDGISPQETNVPKDTTIYEAYQASLERGSVDHTNVFFIILQANIPQGSSSSVQPSVASGSGSQTVVHPNGSPPRKRVKLGRKQP